MQCPSCDASSVVVAIQEDDARTWIKRRRRCVACDKGFTTIETARLVDIVRGGVTEPFSRQAVLTDLRAAVQADAVVLDAQAGSFRERHGPPSEPATGYPPLLREAEHSMSGAWSPFPLASASGRG